MREFIKKAACEVTARDLQAFQLRERGEVWADVLPFLWSFIREVHKTDLGIKLDDVHQGKGGTGSVVCLQRVSQLWDVAEDFTWK